MPKVVILFLITCIFLFNVSSVKAEEICISALPDTDWSTVDLSILCSIDINININTIIILGRFNELNPNKLNKDNINNNMFRFTSAQFMLGEKEFIQLIKPENVQSIIHFLTPEQKKWLTLEQLDYSNNLEAIKEIHYLDYDVLHKLFDKRGFNITVVSASNLIYTTDVLSVNETSLNIKGCDIASCAIIVDTYIGVLQNFSNDDTDIFTNAQVNGSVSFNIVDHIIYITIKNDASYFDIAGTISHFIVLTSTGKAFLNGSMEGSLTAKDGYFKSSNAILFFSDKYVIGDSEVFFNTDLSVNNISIYASNQGYQSKFIDINSSMTLETVGYAVCSYFSSDNYISSVGDALLIKNTEDATDITTRGRLNLHFYDSVNPNGLNFLSRNIDSKMHYEKAGSNIYINTSGLVDLDLGVDDAHIGWSSSKLTTQFDFISDGSQSYLDVLGDSGDGDIGDIRVGISMFTISDVVRYKLIKSVSQMQIQPNLNDLKRVTSEYAQTGYSELSAPNLVIRLNDDTTISDTNRVSYYAIDSSFISGSIEDSGIVSPIYPPTATFDAIGQPEPEKTSQVMKDTMKVSELVDSQKYADAILKLQTMLRASANSNYSDINTEIMILQSIYDLYSLDNNETTFAQKKSMINQFINEAYSNSFNRDTAFASILIANAQDADNEAELISTIDSARSILKNNAQINQLLFLISKEDFDTTQMSEHLFNFVTSNNESNITSLYVKFTTKKLLETYFMSALMRQQVITDPSYKTSAEYFEDSFIQINSLKGLLSLEMITIEDIVDGVSFKYDAYNVSSNLNDYTVELSMELASTYAAQGKYSDALAVIDDFYSSLLAPNLYASVKNINLEITDSEGYEIYSGDASELDSLNALHQKIEDFRASIILSNIHTIQMDLLISQEDIVTQLEKREGAISKIFEGDMYAFFTVGMGKDIYSMMGGYNSVKNDAQRLSVESSNIYDGSYAIASLVALGVPRGLIKAWILNENVTDSEMLGTYLIISSGSTTYSQLSGDVEQGIARSNSDGTIVSKDFNNQYYSISAKNKDGISNQLVSEFLEDIRPKAKYVYTDSIYSQDFQSMIGTAPSLPGTYHASKLFVSEQTTYKKIINDKLGPTKAGKILSTVDNFLLNPFDVTLMIATAGSSKVLMARNFIEKSVTKTMFKVPGVGRALTWGFSGGVIRRTTTHIVGGAVVGVGAGFIPGDNMASESLRQVLYRIGLHSSVSKESKAIKTLLKEKVSGIDELEEANKNAIINKINSMDSKTINSLTNEESMLNFLQSVNMEKYQLEFKTAITEYQEFELRRYASMIGEENLKKRLGDDVLIKDGLVYYKGHVLRNIDELRSILERSRIKAVQSEISDNGLKSLDDNVEFNEVYSNPDKVVSNLFTGCIVGCPSKTFRNGDRVFVQYGGQYYKADIAVIQSKSNSYLVGFYYNNNLITLEMSGSQLYTLNRYHPGQRVTIIRDKGYRDSSARINKIMGDGKYEVLVDNGQGAKYLSAQELDSWNAPNVKPPSAKNHVANNYNDGRNIVKKNIEAVKQKQNTQKPLDNVGIKNFFKNTFGNIFSRNILRKYDHITQDNSIYARRFYSLIEKEGQSALQNKFYSLAWTHNVQEEAIDAIFSSKRLMPQGSRGLSFRYGIDNHYGDIVFIAKKKVVGLRPSDGSNVYDDIFGSSMQRYGKQLEPQELLYRDAMNARLKSYAQGYQATSYSTQIDVADPVSISEDWIEAILVPEHMYKKVLASAKKNGISPSLLVQVPTGTKAEYIKDGILDQGTPNLEQAYRILYAKGYVRDPGPGGKVVRGAVSRAGPESFRKVEDAYYNVIAHNPAYVNSYKIITPGVNFQKTYFLPDTEITLEPGLKEAFAWAEKQGLTFGVTGGSYRRARLGYDRATLDRSDFDLVLPNDNKLKSKGYDKWSYVEEIRKIIADTRKVDRGSLVLEWVGTDGRLDSRHYGSPSFTIDKVIVQSDRTIVAPPSTVFKQSEFNAEPIWDMSSINDVLLPVARNTRFEGVIPSSDHRQSLRAIRELTEYSGLPIEKVTRRELIAGSSRINNDVFAVNFFKENIDKKVRKIFDTSQDPALSIAWLKELKVYEPLVKVGYDFDAMAKGDYYTGLYKYYSNQPGGQDKLRKIYELQKRHNNDARQITQKEIDVNNIFIDK